MSEPSYVWTDDPIVSKYYLFFPLFICHIYFGIIIIIDLAMYYNIIVWLKNPSC